MLNASVNAMVFRLLLCLLHRQMLKKPALMQPSMPVLPALLEMWPSFDAVRRSGSTWPLCQDEDAPKMEMYGLGKDPEVTPGSPVAIAKAT